MVKENIEMCNDKADTNKIEEIGYSWIEKIR
jgi:hypothetical protein